MSSKDHTDLVNNTSKMLARFGLEISSPDADTAVIEQQLADLRTLLEENAEKAQSFFAQVASGRFVRARIHPLIKTALYAFLESMNAAPSGRTRKGFDGKEHEMKFEDIIPRFPTDPRWQVVPSDIEKGMNFVERLLACREEIRTAKKDIVEYGGRKAEPLREETIDALTNHEIQIGGYSPDGLYAWASKMGGVFFERLITSIEDDTDQEVYGQLADFVIEGAGKPSFRHPIAALDRILKKGRTVRSDEPGAKPGYALPKAPQFIQEQYIEELDARNVWLQRCSIVIRAIQEIADYNAGKITEVVFKDRNGQIMFRA